MTALTSRGAARCDASPVKRCPLRRIRPEIAIAEAYEAHGHELYAYAMSLCHDPATAEDAVAEAFCRLTREVGAGRGPDRTRAWLYRVTANILMSNGRHATVVERALPRLIEVDLQEAPDARLIAIERRADLTVALGDLPPEVRLGLLLAANGVSGRRIAAVLGRTEAATRTFLCRGRRRLRTRLQQNPT